MSKPRLTIVGLLAATVVSGLGWLNEASLRGDAEHQLAASRASADSLKRLAVETEIELQETLSELHAYKPLVYDEEELKLYPEVRRNALTTPK